MSEDLKISQITDADVEAVVALWQRAGLTRPWNDPHADIAFARAGVNATVLVGRVDGGIVAATMVGHDGHRGALYYVAVDPDQRRCGHGAGIIAAAEAWLRERGIWKLNLLVRAGNDAATDFYAALGFEEQPRVYMEKWIDPARKPAGH